MNIEVKIGCQCEKCKQLCIRNPGWFAPGEAKRAIDMGLADQLMLDWIDEDPRYNITKKTWVLSPASDGRGGKLAPEWDEMHGDTTGFFLFHGSVWKGRCIFFQSGLCRIHDTDFKPAECRSAFGCGKKNSVSEHIEIGKLWDSADGRAAVALWKSKVGFVEEYNKTED